MSREDGEARLEDSDKELPDAQFHMDDEVEVIHECFQSLMRLDERARLRALFYLVDRMFEEQR